MEINSIQLKLLHHGKKETFKKFALANSISCSEYGSIKCFEYGCAGSIKCCEYGHLGSIKFFKDRHPGSTISSSEYGRLGSIKIKRSVCPRKRLAEFPQCPNREKLPSLSERLTLFGIMGAQLRAPLTPLDTISFVMFEVRGVSGGHQLCCHDVKRRQFLQ